MSSPVDPKKMLRRAQALAILEACCKPGFYGTVEVFFEDGEPRGKYRLETTVQPETASPTEIEKKLDTFLGLATKGKSSG